MQKQSIVDDKLLIHQARLLVLSAIGDTLKREDPRRSTEDRINDKIKEYSKRLPELDLQDYLLITYKKNQYSVVNHKRQDIIIVNKEPNLELNELQLKDSLIENSSIICKFESLNSFKDYKISLTGHSLGGTISEWVAIKKGLDCETFNRGPNPFTQKLQKESFIISHFVRGDPLSTASGVGIIHYVEGFLNQKIDDYINNYEKQESRRQIQHPKSQPLQQQQQFQQLQQQKERQKQFQQLLKKKQEQDHQSQQQLQTQQQQLYEQQQQSQKKLFNNKKTKQSDFPAIKGFYMSEENNVCNFLMEDQIKNKGIEMEDLEIALLVFSDKDVNQKQISFSLDQYDEKNPNGEFLKKVYYPDTFEKKIVIEGTNFGDIMFEADWVMKQLSLGICVASMDPISCQDMIYNDKLKNLGLAPSYTFKDKNSQSTDNDWARLWLVVKGFTQTKFKDNLNDGDKYIELNDFVMGVEARQMEPDSTGMLVDRKVQDTNHRSYKFAEKFTQIYDQIAEEFPIFQRLKQLSKAIALAQWMWLNKIPIDLDKIKEKVKQQRIQNQSNKVPALSRDYVTKTSSSSVFSMNVQTSRVSVFGGVNVQVNFDSFLDPENKKNCPIKEPNKFIDCKTMLARQLPDQKDQFPNPYRPMKDCLDFKCKAKLELYELNSSYCKEHDPHACQRCYKDIVNEQYLRHDDQSFHKKCFNCFQCSKPLENAFQVYGNKLNIHPDCSAALDAKISQQKSSSASKMNSAYKRTLDLLSHNELDYLYDLEASFKQDRIQKEDMKPILSTRKATLAVLSEITYSIPSDGSSRSCNERLTDKMKEFDKRIPQLKLSEYELVDSNKKYMFAVVNHKTKELIFVHKGTDFDWNDIRECLRISIGNTPRRIPGALGFTENITRKYPGYKITHSGHSLGGTTSEIVAFQTGQTYESFNAPTHEEQPGSQSNVVEGDFLGLFLDQKSRIQIPGDPFSPHKIKGIVNQYERQHNQAKFTE